jgi:23S rRNA (cytidine1920-2'-O)/16S rRNA (cytidine1409-2'-O)-methyltransferase
MAAAETIRLDTRLVELGLARSRSVAARLIEGGLVSVAGRPVVKPSAKVSADASIEVDATDRWVSRGALKLIAALDAFDLAPDGRLALDAGASTGGFTQVLLDRGAREVIALDVGHGQLAAELIDARVRSFEGVNVRELDRARLASLTGSDELPTLVTADLSFISLRYVLAPLAACAAPDADLVVLIKPQFEVGRTGVREGIVRDAGLRADAIASVLWTAWDEGLATAGLISSPIAGSAGNREYLAHLVPRGSSHPAPSSDRTEWGSPSAWEERIPRLAGE